MKWLDFSIDDDKCPHNQDYYVGCPLCREEKLQEEVDELVNMLEEHKEMIGSSLLAWKLTSDTADTAQKRIEAQAKVNEAKAMLKKINPLIAKHRGE